MKFDFFTILTLQLSVTLCTKLTDVTNDLFTGKSTTSKVFAAFGDFNADKLVDIFLVGDKGELLIIMR